MLNYAVQKTLKLLCLSLLLCCAHLICPAQSFQHTKYTVDDGLPSSEVYESLQDQNGYLWFATDAGVCRYDGYTFKNFSTLDGLPYNTIFHLYEDQFGKIWFLSATSELSYFEHGKIHRYPFNAKLQAALPKKDWIRTINIDANNVLHFALLRNGYGSITEAGELDFHDTNDKPYHSLHLESHGKERLLCRTNAGSSQFDTTLNLRLFLSENEDEFFEFGCNLRMNQQRQFELNDSTLLLSIGEHLVWIQGDSVQFASKKHTLNHPLNYVHQDANGRLWMAWSGLGLQIFDSFNHLSKQSPPSLHMYPDLNVSGINADIEGGIWVAVQNQGVYYLPNVLPLLAFNSTNALDQRITALTMTSDSTIAFGTSNGKVFSIGRDGKTQQILNESGSRSVINHLDYDLKSEVLLVHTGDRTYGQKLNTTANLKVVVSAAGDACFANDGTYWIASSKGLVGLKDSAVAFTSVTQNPDLRFLSVFEDKMGRIWAGGEKGLYQVEQGKLIHKTSISPLLSVRIEDISELQDGTLLFGTKGNGLLVLKEGKVTQVTVNHGLTSELINSIYVDEHKTIWVATNRGLNRVKLTESGNVSVQQIGKTQGLPSNEVEAVLVTGNTLWAATTKGLAYFDYTLLTRNFIPPFLSIDSVGVNESFTMGQSDFELQHDGNFIDIAFSGRSFRNPNPPSYRYFLAGIDQSWSYTTSRSARYPSLPPGDYDFLVQVANEDNLWSPPKQIKFHIAQPFWTSWWFILLCIAAGLVAVLLPFRYREKQMRKVANKDAQIERYKMQALRAQMNPHFIFNTINSIQYFMLNNKMKETSEYISKFAKLIRSVLHLSSENLVTLDEEIEMLKLYLDLEQDRFDNRFEYDVKVEDEISVQMDRIPPMLMQPFVENAVWHGLMNKNGQGLISIVFSKNREHLKCTITDNGIGRKQAEELKKKQNSSRKSVGMSVTEDRLELHNKNVFSDLNVEVLDLLDAQGDPAGTQVILNIKAE